MKGRFGVRDGMARRLFPAVLAAGQLALLTEIVRRGWDVTTDSAGYIEGVVLRSPLYPLLIAACRSLFGEGALWAVVAIQASLAVAAVGTVAAFLRYRLRTHPAVALAAAAILDFPLLVSRIANHILTESVAYALFLLAFVVLLEALSRRSEALYFAHLGLVSLTVLTRPQFVFLLPVSAAALVLLLLGKPWRKRVAATLALLATLAFTWFADRGYHWLRHDHFGNVPFTGVQLIAGALYVSQETDGALFSGDEADFFRQVRGQAAEAGHLASDNPHPGSLGAFVEHFSASYNDIVWTNVARTYARRYHGGGKMSPKAYAEMDDVLNRMALRLIAANPLAYLRLYVSNLAFGVGANTLFLLLGLGAAAAWLAVDGQRIGLAFALALLLHLANTSVVALFEPAIHRYLFHTESLLLAVVPALLVSLAHSSTRGTERQRTTESRNDVRNLR